MIALGSQHSEEPAEQISQPAGHHLAGFAEQCDANFVRLARCLIRRSGLDTTEFSAEAAVNHTWSVLLERLKDDRIRPIRTRDDCEKAFSLVLGNVILDESRRQKARKRSGGRGILDSGLDRIAARAVPPDDYVIGEDQAERLLGILDREDASLREIAILRAQDFSIAEIASKRGVSISTIERALQTMRSLLGPHIDRRDRS